MEPKMPEEALYIMAELLPRVPDARLVMAGGHGRNPENSSTNQSSGHQLQRDIHPRTG